MVNEPRWRHVSRDKAARQYGIIKCYGPKGEYFEARSLGEAGELTGVSKSAVHYAIATGNLSKGWRFTRGKDNTES